MSGFGSGRFGEGVFGDDGPGATSPPPSVPDPSIRWQLLGVNPDQTIDAELEPTGFTLIPRHLARGSWTADAAFDGNLNTAIGRLLRPGAGIVAVANGTSVFSGPVTKFKRNRNGDVNTISVGGTDDLLTIASRVAHQDYANADTPEADHTFRTSRDDQGGVPAETAIKHFVNVNAGPGAIASRQVAGLTVEADAARGLSKAWPAGAIGWNLLDLIVKIATNANLGVRVVRVDSTHRQFQVYVPEDKTASVVFSVELGNVQGFEYGTQAPDANVEYVGGPGSGATRLYSIVADFASATAWGRIEKFNDQGSVDTVQKLATAGQTDLLATAAKFYVTVTTLPTEGLAWRPIAKADQKTFDIGDTVSAVVDGQKIAEVIRELTIDVSAAGTTIAPTIGSPTDGGPHEKKLIDALIARLHTQGLALADLQRR